MEKVQLLIIDEHEAVRNALATRLSSNPNIEVVATIQNFSQQNLNESGSADVALYGLKSSSDADLDATISVVEDLTCQGTAVIVLTSYADDIERELLLKSGAYRYLLKNINSNKLIAEILEVAAETTEPLG
ncbi:MAG: response regulator transcription factor [Chloroflexi bacterium]|nr:response regulator transcription factor [Chloroflexota bacterium]MBK6709453.1 response regulator transcription factor [Chloroflexota bacterium]MBK7178586.1 response regulator transcription factor [Chloroflexota bacterium]MBK7915222.1 response regulator transcription factor [Chloroflexota bacterium]MBP6806215.1 response regulator transcription factor [Chloroflexota bacterium]